MLALSHLYVFRPLDEETKSFSGNAEHAQDGEKGADDLREE